MYDALAHVSAPGEPSRVLWHGTDVLLERATVAGILAHRLGPLAAERLRRVGRPVPESLRLQERAAVLGMRTSQVLVERIRASCDGPLLLIKGPEVASVYPATARRFSDIDVVTPDAPGVHRKLGESGFVRVPFDRDTPDQHHHLDALRWPTISLGVEVHMSPGWLRTMRPPTVAALLEASVPSALGIDGVRAPAAPHHALILAVHAWGDEPLQTLRDLIDVAALAAPVDPRELEQTARVWGMERVWQTTWRTIEHLFYGGPSSLAIRTWARHLDDVRERTVFEHHVMRWLSPYWELPFRPALARSTRNIGEEVRPMPGESWGEKLGRTRHALRNPRAPVTRCGHGPATQDTGSHSVADEEA